MPLGRVCCCIISHGYSQTEKLLLIVSIHMNHKPVEAIMRQHNHFANKPQQNQWLLTRLQKYKISVSYVPDKGLLI